MNGDYENEVSYVPPVYEERRYEAKPVSPPVAKAVQDDDEDDRYAVNGHAEPFEFESTQAPVRHQPIQAVEQVIAKPASKKKINPFASKPQNSSFLLASAATPLGSLKAATKPAAPATAPYVEATTGFMLCKTL